MSKKADLQMNHRFLDEVGDTTFYSKGKVDIVGSNGVSKCFILGMVKLKEPLAKVRDEVKKLQTEVENNSYFKVPSVEKRIKEQGDFTSTHQMIFQKYASFSLTTSRKFTVALKP